MLNEVKPNLDLLMSIRLGLAEQYGIPLDVPFRDYKAWYRWTGMEVPTQTMRADFVNQLYSKEGKPCRFEDIFEFERLSKAWLFDEDGLQECGVDEPRFRGGILLEGDTTNGVPSPAFSKSNRNTFDVKIEDISIKGSHHQAVMITGSGNTPGEYNEYKSSTVRKDIGSTKNIIYVRIDNSNVRYMALATWQTTHAPTHDYVTKVDLKDLEVIRVGSYNSNVGISKVGIYVRVEFVSPVNTAYNWITVAFGNDGDNPNNHGTWAGLNTDESIELILPTRASEIDSFDTVIPTDGTPVTRLRDSLTTPIPQGHTISGDWDDTLHLFERDGQLDFEGYGYIRTLEMIPMEGSYTADFTKDAIISHTGFEHRGIFGRGIFEFERLSKAWTWESNKGMVEFDVNAPRITYEGLLLEPESTNFLVDSFLSSGRAGMQVAGGDLFFEVDELGTHIHFKQTLNDNYAYKNYQDLDAPDGSHSLTCVSDTTGLSFGESSAASLRTIGALGSRLEEVSYGVYSGKANMQNTGQAGNSRGFIKRTYHNTIEPKFYLYQLENYPRYTSPIKTEGVPVTRLPETLTHPTSLEFLTIDKDEGILHEDGVFSGFGYIRKIEVKV